MDFIHKFLLTLHLVVDFLVELMNPYHMIARISFDANYSKVLF